ncbi:methyltransferase RsmF C-terminal domain-like protein [Runella salmonicolor]|uniref:RNA methyltransferase n=1 Tax=Runella salmonicolor TaxID=2950278 RepID=A0ABT1FN93_9BACT|nr:RNA methyltransferase [Runella salmonicolor]MCP1383235.1 RNA methyltransferase [Runella salmonicolor]
MIQFPQPFIQELKAQLGDEYADFEAALQQSPPVSIRYNSAKFPNFPTEDTVKWCSEARYLPSRPVFTLDPLFHAGAYYVQEASSMLIGEALAQTVDLSESLRVLDLCAAPGGKTTLLASKLSSDSLLLANEVIRSRVMILKENVQKWGFPNVHVSNHDPEDLEKLAGFFDVILIDAPCSGEGLFRKDPAAVGEWSMENVQICAGRQKRILSAAMPLLSAGGVLIYCTCTYNDAENQDSSAFVVDTHQFEEVKLQWPADWGIIPKKLGYQCYPHRVKGEGFFLAAFRKTAQLDSFYYNMEKGGRPRSFKPLHKKQLNEISRWLQEPDDFSFYEKPNGEVVALLESQKNDLIVLDNLLFAKGLGLEMGSFKGTDFIPSHALALSTALSAQLPRLELSEGEALQFLKKENLLFDAPKGWLLVTHQGLGLGWVKGLGNRINNYLPKEWRIRMEIPE